VLGSVWPFSSRAMVDWLVPIRTQVRPATSLREGERSGSAAISNSGANTSYSVNGVGCTVPGSCHAVMLCFYFSSFIRIQKTLVVTPAIAAGIVDKVLHEVGCAALMNANQAPALRGPYKKRVTEIGISNGALPDFEIWKRTRLPLMSTVITFAWSVATLPIRSMRFE
jgi:hypothetical protein